MAKQTDQSANRGERILAYMLAAMLGLSILAFFTVIIGTFAGATDLGAGLWPIVYLVMYFALPLAIVILITLVIVSARRRSREASDQAAQSAARADKRRPGSSRSG